MGESWLSVLLAATVTTMTMMACVTRAADLSSTAPLTIARDDLPLDSKRVRFLPLVLTCSSRGVRPP